MADEFPARYNVMNSLGRLKTYLAKAQISLKGFPPFCFPILSPRKGYCYSPTLVLTGVGAKLVLSGWTPLSFREGNAAELTDIIVDYAICGLALARTLRRTIFSWNVSSSVGIVYKLYSTYQAFVLWTRWSVCTTPNTLALGGAEPERSYPKNGRGYPMGMFLAAVYALECLVMTYFSHNATFKGASPIRARCSGTPLIGLA